MQMYARTLCTVVVQISVAVLLPICRGGAEVDPVPAASTAEERIEGLIKAGESSWHPSGLFSYRSGDSNRNQVHLIRLGPAGPEPVFRANLSHRIHRPISLKSAVVAVGFDGLVTCLALDGSKRFEERPVGFAGASGMSGRLNDHIIYITETTTRSGKKGWVYHLYLVDVSGQGPRVRAQFRIDQPLKVTSTSSDVIVISPKSIKRLPIPKELASAGA